MDETPLIEKTWYLYVLETADGTFYTGITTDIDRRVQQHNAGKGAKYTSLRCPVKLLGAWQTNGRSNALKLELAFKRLPRSQKLRLVSSNQPFKDAPKFR